MEIAAKYRLKSSFYSLSLFIGVLFFSINVQANVIFEGYFRIMQQNQYIGFFIQRYEYDAKKKQFTSTSFLRTSPSAGDIQESIQATADQSLKPLRHRYTLVRGTQTKSIDASYINGVMDAIVTVNNRPQKLQSKIGPHTFQSTFLTYMLLQSKEGVSKGNKFRFQAIAEEEAKVYPGEVYVESEITYKGQKAFRILNTFKGSKFVNVMNIKGEPLFVRAPASGMTLELVNDPIDATSNQPYNPKNIELLFGGMPSGKINELHKNPNASTMIQQQQMMDQQKVKMNNSGKANPSGKSN